HPLHIGYDLGAAASNADVLCFLDMDVPWIPAAAMPPADAIVVQCGPDPHYSRYPIRTHRSDLSVTASVFDWCARGHAGVVVDMTGTQSWDPAVIRELALAHQRAQAEGGGLRLVIPAASDVLRVFTVTGLDRFFPRYASREDALSHAIAAAVWNAHPRGRATAPIREHGPSEVA